MGKKITMDFLAQKLNMSKTTISKAINNCPGIASRTKSIITDAASSYGYMPNRINNRVSVVLPSVPDYFWGSMRKNIDSYAKKSGLSYSCYIYPNVADTQSVLQCINQALSDKTSVLIMATGGSAEVKERIEAVSDDILVILIEEFSDIKNSFFIGENSAAQGYRIMEEYIRTYPDSDNFVILHTTDFYTEQQRIDGAKAALDKYNKTIIGNVRFNSETKAKAAGIARELATLPVLPDCIFAPSGNIHCAADAVRKLKTEKNIHCIGFDMYTRKDYDKEIFTHILLQDIDTQAKTACDCAKRFLNSSFFPDSKCIYINDIYL